MMAKVVPDTMFEAMSLEFGGGSERPKAVWRLSLMELKTSFRGIPRKYRQISRTLSDSRYKSWRNWPKPMKRISISKAKSFFAFQKRLGY